MRMSHLLPLLALTGCGVLGPNAVCPGEDPALYRNASPTTLDMDCRCHANFEEPECTSVDQATSQGLEYGEGPKLWEMGVRVRNGDIWPEREEIIVAVSNGDDRPGFVLALDYQTGDRRIISGAYTDAYTGDTEVGSGEMWMEPTYALRGEDGQIYVYAHGNRYGGAGLDVINEIWRVDPDSGDRTLVWQHALKDPDFDGPYGYCTNGDPDGERNLQLMLEGAAFEMTDDGAFLIGTIRNGIPAPGVSVVEISPDGSECRVVSMNPGEAGNRWVDGVGGGFSFGLAVEAISYVNGEIYVMDNNNLLTVDRETGDRTRLMSLGMPGVLQWDEQRELFHLSAIEPPYTDGGYLGTVIPESEESWLWSGCLTLEEGHPFADGCLNAGNAEKLLNNNQAWLLPDGRHMITVNDRNLFGIIDIEAATMNHFSI